LGFCLSSRNFVIRLISDRYDPASALAIAMIETAASYLSCPPERSGVYPVLVHRDRTLARQAETIGSLTGMSAFIIAKATRAASPTCWLAACPRRNWMPALTAWSSAARAGDEPTAATTIARRTPSVVGFFRDMDVKAFTRCSHGPTQSF